MLSTRAVDSIFQSSLSPLHIAVKVTTICLNLQWHEYAKAVWEQRSHMRTINESKQLGACMLCLSVSKLQNVIWENFIVFSQHHMQSNEIWSEMTLNFCPIYSSQWQNHIRALETATCWQQFHIVSRNVFQIKCFKNTLLTNVYICTLVEPEQMHDVEILITFFIQN